MPTPGDKPLDKAASYKLGPHAKECDMVMKGGITSGVVYPRAACHLATTYRFRRLGGSSAGAIAATMVAAAELGRGKTGGGFVRLDELPDELGASLSTRFQASPGTKPAFSLLTTMIDPELTTPQKLKSALLLIGRRSWPVGVAAFLVTLVPAAAFVIGITGAPRTRHEWWLFSRDLAVFLPLALAVAIIVGLVAGLVKLALNTLNGMNANGFGLCDGHTHDPSVGTAPPLTDWMTDVLDELAGREKTGRPLTFGDLWGPEAAAAYREAMPTLGLGEASALSLLRRQELAKDRDLDVVVMTTDLSHRRPYRFPFDTQIFYWCPDCLSVYFPDRVIEQMKTTSAATEPEGDHQEDDRTLTRVCPAHGTRLWYLPRAVDMPVVVAARVSLSFPALISAVPFHVVDFATVPSERGVKPAWFSDGGIASNFPMHFFDQPLPTRPTFGINLQPVVEGSDEMVRRPRTANQGTQARYHAIESMPGFVHAIADTMQNWVDNLQSTMRGFKDRVAEVRLTDEEGGMNLKMKPTTITEIANRGAEAAAEFDDFEFGRHQVERYRIAMAGIDELLAGIEEPYIAGYKANLPDWEIPQRLRTESNQLAALAGKWRAADHPAQNDAPRPQPRLRFVARQ